MATNKRSQKAFIRFDGTGKAVSSSLIWRNNKPKVGNWKEIEGYECCNPIPGPIQRCTINDSGNPDPYGGNPYFSMQKFWQDPTYVFTLIRLNINGVEYATGQTLTVNNPADIQVGIGLDGRTYYTNTVDWINSLIPSSTGLVFYDDFNTVDHPENMLFQIIIQDAPSGSSPAVSYYKYDNLGLQIAYGASGLPVDEMEFTNISTPPSIYTNCTNL